MAKSTQTKSIAPAGAKLHRGSCHCGAVRYEVTIDTRNGSRCNCSICTKVAQLGGIVVPDAFKLLTSVNASQEYAWGSKSARRVFCKTCGVHCYGQGYLKELGGDFISINYNALDDVDPSDVNVAYWDGRHDNWQAGTKDEPWKILQGGAVATDGAESAA